MYSVATDQDIQDMARGAVFLGSGGGGDPYVGELYLRRQLTEGRQARIVKAAELPDDAFVISIAGVGAPTVLVEHLVSTNTLLRLARTATKPQVDLIFEEADYLNPPEQQPGGGSRVRYRIRAELTPL